MKTLTFRVYLLLAAAAVPRLAGAQPSLHYSPAAFGVVDVIPNNESGETDNNTEPSLGIGTSGRKGKFYLHTFSPGAGFNNEYFTSVDNGMTWANGGSLTDNDATTDWTFGGAYAAILSETTTSWSINVLACSDPTEMDPKIRTSS